MNILLDTHSLIWWLDGSKGLPKNLVEQIQKTENEIFVSSVSLWEIRIKEALKKIKIPKYFEQAIEEQGFLELNLTWEHTTKLKSLPLHHRDPFDRMLIAQALSEKLTFASRDHQNKKYNVPIIWGS